MKKVWLLVFAAGWVCVFNTGCATYGPRAERSGRSGLFDEASSTRVATRPRTNRDEVEEPVQGRKVGQLREVARTWRWPLNDVSVTSQFGQRGESYHEGIDLRAQIGTPVYAAHPGKVLYSGRKIRGYGNMIVLQHASGMVTVYGHNSKNLVRKGQLVRQGTRIALSGNTGRSTGPHLHFEVRHHTSPLDPLAVMNTRTRHLAYNERRNSAK